IRRTGFLFGRGGRLTRRGGNGLRVVARLPRRGRGPVYGDELLVRRRIPGREVALRLDDDHHPRTDDARQSGEFPEALHGMESFPIARTRENFNTCQPAPGTGNSTVSGPVPVEWARIHNTSPNSRKDEPSAGIAVSRRKRDRGGR